MTGKKFRSELLMLLAAGCAQDTGPHLSSAMPASATRGATVTIAGERMCPGDCAHAAGELTIGNVRATLTAFSDTSAQLAVPDAVPVGHTSIILTVNDTASNALSFEVLP
jgi:hypothetical protein